VTQNVKSQKVTNVYKKKYKLQPKYSNVLHNYGKSYLDQAD